MSTCVRIDELHDHVDRVVELRGWLSTARFSGKIGFLIVRDGTGLCQCVVEKGGVGEEPFAEARHLPQESSLIVTGSVRADERAVGGHELLVSELRIVHKAEPYPITPKPHGVDFLMNHRHLWLRSRRQTLIMRIRATLVDAIRRFFNDRGFVLIDTPIFAPSAGEGASTLFEVDYFGEPVYLAQTGQLYLEAACMALGKVYCFGPTFRAEKSKTRRHLTEFWMVEPEIPYADLDDVVAVAEDFICAIVGRVLADHEADIEFLGRDLAPLRNVRKPFVRVSYSECVDILRSPETEERLTAERADKQRRVEELEKLIEETEAKRGQGGKQWQVDKWAREVADAREEHADLVEEVRNIPHHVELARNFAWGKDLGGSDETIISRRFDRPIVVHRYPREAKAFYMKADPDDPRVVKNFDLLAPEGFGEIIGGSQREDDRDALVARMTEDGMEVGPYEWYLDLRRHGSVPHGGFGLGVERTLGWICGLKHVREAGAFPRMMGKLYP